MRFLGGLLKFFSVLVLLVATIFCTVVIAVEGVMNGNSEAIWLMSAAWLASVFVGLTILAGGIALSQITKLNKRVAYLEKKLWTTVSATSAPVPEQFADPIAETPVAVPNAQPEKSGIIRWLPVIISSVLVVAAIVLVVVVGGKKTPAPVAPAPSIEEVDPDSIIYESIDFGEDNSEASIQRETEEIPMGSSLSTDFVEMTFDEIVIQEDVRKSVTIDISTRITGPEPLPGQTYICLSGKIVNTSTNKLPVYDFFMGQFQIGDYQYNVSATDCDVLSPNGSIESTIDPLLEYEYRIYTAIPYEMEELVASGEAFSFTFGFYDDFDNQELAANRVISDDPIAECPYQYFVCFQ